jgi:hypothetical protein
MKPIDVMRYRSTGGVVPVLDVAASSSGVAAPVIAQVQFNNDGTFSDGATGNWYLPTTVGIGASYEIRLDGTSSGLGGGAVIGTYGAWVALSSNPIFGIRRNTSSLGVNFIQGDLSVRIGGVTVLTGTFAFEAEVL